MIMNIINEYLRANREEFLSQEKFFCSDAGKCLRMRFLKRKGIEPPETYDDRTLRLFEAGNIFHKWVQDTIAKSTCFVAKELIVEDEHRRGRIDLIIYHEDKLILYDLKTVHSGKFSFLSREKDKHYHFQVLTYIDLLPEGYKPEFARICYISKDDLRVSEIDVDFSFAEENRHNWEELFRYWRAQIEPPPVPCYDWECKYCLYKKRCRGENF